MRKSLFLIFVLAVTAFSVHARQSRELKSGWEFCLGDESAYSTWEEVNIPHDWAIYGPFDRSNDLQTVKIEQNFETEETVKTGRTGGLPYVGKGSYRTTFTLDQIDGKSVTLVFDGAMSNAHVEVNGVEVCQWPYGYNSFWCNIDSVVCVGENTLRVNLENLPKSSRWYPGAGLYRNVHLIITDRVHVPVWGTYITTPHVDKEESTVKLETTLVGLTNGEKTTLSTEIVDPEGRSVASASGEFKYYDGYPMQQVFVVRNPSLWSPESPALYTAITTVIVDGVETDSYSTCFGIRSIEYVANKGFYLNGEKRKFQGVCNHHDLGPLGAAVNKAALRHQLELLKDMGCDAIRTSHNMPAPELVELCDEMGFMMMIEPFDDWDFYPKSENGYYRLFTEWAERDMVNMIHHYRNNPSVVMWSIGNEVPNQWGPDGMKAEKMLQDICHREDPTRPVTCGMDQFDAVISNGFGALLDIPGFNYKVNRYKEAYGKLPQLLILGSETASTVSSRGVYHFPVEMKADAKHDDHQSSSYDVEYCFWSNVPDDDFAVDDDLDYNIGQFVWTGFDYLGEPSPYDTDAWPNHSSMFGIIDLASIPKDRYYLYRSRWNKEDQTLHILPHWNWHGREGQVTPVFVYTSYPKAELWLNGESLGIREKNDSTHLNRYRLMWNEVRYQPGELKVVAYDDQGNAADTAIVRTSGKAHHLVATVDRSNLSADGEDLAYITVTVADKDGNPVPTDERLVKFTVTGAGSFRAAANGDPTCLYPFHKPEMPLFSGALTAIVQAGNEQGTLKFTATAKGLKPVDIYINVE